MNIDVGIVAKLAEYCELQADEGADGAYVLTFRFPNAVCTARIALSSGGVVVTHTAVLPAEEAGNGHDGKAIEAIAEWARTHGLNRVQFRHERNPGLAV